jgi:histidyl-tRNA synthetase
MAKTFETPKGTRDFLPEEMRVRSAVFDRLRRAFQLFGFEELDTPAFEYLEVLTLKAGPAAEREIYSFEDKGGRRLGLRFDLTSSTGRVMAAHPELKRPIYRYQIGKVWRYDRPAAGRYREFYQADADIIGSSSMDCEVDLLLLATTVLREFGLSDYSFVVNNRKILEAQVRKAGIAPEKKADALRALDKRDKIGLPGIRQEAVGYGIDVGQFDAFLGQLGLLEGQADLNGLGYLDHAAALLKDDEAGRTGVEELRYIMARAAGLGFADRVTIDPTLARGLDYYTGPIFEAKAHVERFGGKLSFAGGGRYDDLIELYGGMPQGAVGFSFGVERLIELLKEQAGDGLGAARPVLVAPLLFGNKRSEGLGSIGESAERLAQALRAQGIAARIGLAATAPGKHLQYAEAAALEWIIFVGEDEVQKGQYPLRQLSSRSEERLSLEGLIDKLRGLPR